MQLASWAAFLAFGIVLSVAMEARVLVGLAGAVLLACPWIFWKRAWTLGRAVLAFSCGVGLGAYEVRQAILPAPVREDRVFDILGRITRGADVSDAPAASLEGRPATADLVPSPKRCHLLVESLTIENQSVNATLSLSVLGGVPRVAPGDWVSFRASVYLPRGFANPGLPDPRLLARAQGIGLLAALRSPSELHVVQGRGSPGFSPRRIAFQLRQSMARAISSRLTEPAAGFVRTMVVGERTDVPTQVEDGFRAAGATHVLSVSGLHLAVVAALVFQLFQRLLRYLPLLALRFPPKALASALSLPAVVLYTLLTGEAVATVRSAVMASVVLGAAIANRPFSLSASIAAAGLLILVRSPLSLLDVSFQLSFISVIGLGLFASRILPSAAVERVNGARRSAVCRVAGWLLRSLSASLSASLLTLPLVAHHFGEITPAAPVGNLALVPLVELVVLPFGLAGSLLAMVHPWLGALPLTLAGLASRLALGVADLFRRFAPVMLVRYPNWMETALLTCAAASLLQALAVERSSRRRWLQGCVLFSLLAAGSLGGREVMRQTSTDLRTTFIDVGQGDAALIEGPRGFAALVDGGGRYDNTFDTGARIVEPVLRARGIAHLDLIVLSHPHPDHMNGLMRILKRFSVGMLWTGGSDGGNPAYWDLIRLAEQQGITMPRPTTLALAALVVEPLGPWRDGEIAAPAGLGANDASIVVRFSYVGRRMLFTGDIQADGEEELLERWPAGHDRDADILKIPHHGSRHSSGERFLEAVSPWLAVVSAGKYNRFGLPNPAALARFASRQIPVLRTDRDGAVIVTISDKGEIRTACELGCQE